MVELNIVVLFLERIPTLCTRLHPKTFAQWEHLTDVIMGSTLAFRIECEKDRDCQNL